MVFAKKMNIYPFNFGLCLIYRHIFCRMQICYYYTVGFFVKRIIGSIFNYYGTKVFSIMRNIVDVQLCEAMLGSVDVASDYSSTPYKNRRTRIFMVLYVEGDLANSSAESVINAEAKRSRQMLGAVKLLVRNTVIK